MATDSNAKKGPRGRAVPQKTVLPTVTIELGGLAYEVTPLPSEKAKPWRDELLEPLQGLLSVVSRIDTIEINTPADLALILPHIQDALLNSVDLVRESVLSYAPDVKADWDDGYLSKAQDIEFIQALAQCLRLAYPLEQARALLPKRGGKPGPSALTTPQSSPEQNGVSQTATPDTKV